MHIYVYTNMHIYIYIYIYILWREMVTNSAKWICKSLFLCFFIFCFKWLGTFFFFLLRKANGYCEHFYDGKLSWPAAVSLFVESVNLSFMIESKPDVIKDVSFTKTSDSFATVEVLMLRTLFSFSSIFAFASGKPRMFYNFSWFVNGIYVSWFMDDLANCKK